MKKIIKSVYIRGLWDVKHIHIDFFEDVNILIGGNGSGKTTFLRTVEALLNLDLGAIDDIVFSEVEITILDEEDKKIMIQRIMDDLVTPSYRYIFHDGEVIDMRSDGRIIYRNRFSSRNLYQHLKERLEELINVSWLSINRISESSERPDRRLLDSNRTDVDLKLNLLMAQIISYRLQLETKVNERTKKFNEEIVSMMLYNKSYDTIPTYEQFQSLKGYTTENITTELHRVFSYFGDARMHTQEIKIHAERIKDVINKIDNRDDSLSAEEMLSISLMNRTAAIMKLSAEYQTERAHILAPIKMYIDIVEQYFKDKHIVFDSMTSRLVPIVKIGNNKERNLDMNALSSGEKQLLILLTETLLQQNNPYVFIADEPELSLHIEWQRNLVNSIRSLNPNAQIIFATHAPEIAANHPKKLINMQNVTAYVE